MGLCRRPGLDLCRFVFSIHGLLRRLPYILGFKNQFSLLNCRYFPIEGVKMARILIVDDDPDILHLLTKILTTQGHSIFRAEDAIKAMDYLNNSNFDLLISDANMPRFTGFELVRTIRHNKKYHNMAVAMLTGLRQKKDIEQGIRAGVDDYIIKPIDPIVLLEKIEALFEKKPPQKPQMFEVSEGSHLARAQLKQDTKILSFDEFSVEFISPIFLTLQSSLQLRGMLFSSLGLDDVSVHITSCEEIEKGFKVKGSFVGLRESQQQKIRNWIKDHSFTKKGRVA